jgi:hypothetical protein
MFWTLNRRRHAGRPLAMSELVAALDVLGASEQGDRTETFELLVAMDGAWLGVAADRQHKPADIVREEDA